MTIIASCGHELPPGHMGNSIRYETEDCQPCTVWASVCDACVPKYREWYPDGFVILDDGKADDVPEGKSLTQETK